MGIKIKHTRMMQCPICQYHETIKVKIEVPGVDRYVACDVDNHCPNCHERRPHKNVRMYVVDPLMRSTLGKMNAAGIVTAAHCSIIHPDGINGEVSANKNGTYDAAYIVLDIQNPKIIELLKKQLEFWTGVAERTQHYPGVTIRACDNWENVVREHGDDEKFMGLYTEETIEFAKSMFSVTACIPDTTQKSIESGLSALINFINESFLPAFIESGLKEPDIENRLSTCAGHYYA